MTFDPTRAIAQDDLFFILRDAYPVSPGHTLVIVKRQISRFTDLTPDERQRLMDWVNWCIIDLTKTHQPDGFNVGLNDGPTAGQTIPQLHFHVIPRYSGDVKDPRGGIRHVIPDKARYWTV